MNKNSSTTECPDCEIGSLSRNNYFTGKLLVERDFKDEQRYYIDKLRLHQKRLHGEGVVCGLQVREHASAACRGRFVCVEPGFAKDCCGNDIVAPVEECIDITQFKSWAKLQAAYQAAQNAGRGANPASGPSAGHTLQICVRYRECPTENIPVLYDDCGCDDTACAPNRILESYAFDLLVDPTIKVRRGCLPSIAAASALNGIIASSLAFDPNGTYLYALSSATPSTLYKMDPAGQTQLASYALAGAGKAVAVSDDGSRVYAVSYDSGAGQSSLVVLNSTGLAWIGTSAGLNDDSSPVSLAALPAPQVAWLQSKGAQLLVWDTSAATPVIAKTIALTGTPQGLALGSDRTKAYYVDTTNKQIGAIDISGGAALPPLTLVSNPLEVVLASTGGPDVLAVIDQVDATITAVRTNPATELASISLLNPPLAAAADPQKNVLYVVTQQTTSSGAVTYQLQPFDLKKLVAGSPVLPPGGAPTVQPAGPASVVTNGHEVFVVGSGTTAQGVTAGFHIDAAGCPDLYELEDCDDCCTADCLVLATIRGYQPGFLIEDQATPPSDVVTDYANQIARIDNKLGRVILPSTRKIAEVLEAVACGCACDCQAQTSTTTTTTTNPLIGLNPNLPKIIDIGWTHGGNESWDAFTTVQYSADGPPPPPFTQTPLLTIYFNQKMTGVDRQTFRVEITYPEVTVSRIVPRNTFTGLYNTSRVQIYGYLVDEVVSNPNIVTPNTNETPKSAWVFIPFPEFWATLPTLGLWTIPTVETWKQELDLPCVRVTLSGDFVYAGPPYAESGVLDGDNVGGMVGNPVYSRLGPITGGKNPSGDMVEGGNFESWFYLLPPPAGAVPGQLNVNQASEAQLQTLPGVDAALAEHIVAERANGPFANLEDFEKRLGLSPEAASAIARLTAF